jgi:hypothetical protein
LCGSYQIIGRLPDSDQLYSGKVDLKRSGDHLEVLRLMGGRAVKGIGKIETVTSDKIKVLRVRFRSEEKDYEATYLIGSDWIIMADSRVMFTLRTVKQERQGWKHCLSTTKGLKKYAGDDHRVEPWEGSEGSMLD